MDGVLIGFRCLLAALFVTAGIAKLADAEGSRKTLVGFGISAFWAPSLSVLIPFSEIVIAVSLIFKITAWWGSVAATALLVSFAAAIAFNVAHGRTPACHCFGQLHSAPAGWSTFARNVVLAIISAFLIWRGSANLGPGLPAWLKSLTPLQLAAGLASATFAGVMAATAWVIVHLLHQNGRVLVRLDNLEAQLNMANKGVVHAAPTQTPAHGFTSRSEAPKFELPTLSGHRLGLDALIVPNKSLLLIFSDPRCGPCNAMLPEIAKWQQDYKATLRLAVISRGTADENRQKLGDLAIEPVLLQLDREVADAYHCVGTPTAILISGDGRVASPGAIGIDAIRQLVNVATTDGIHIRSHMDASAALETASVRLGTE